MPCGKITGCWNTAEVNVGYFPYKLIVASAVRVAPNANAAAVLQLPRGAKFGVQSTRNPGNSARPSMRPPRGGFVWGYSGSKGASGWVELAKLAEDKSGAVWADGPANADFQVGAQKPATGRRPSSCAGSDGKDELRVIGVDDVYIRYAPQSTPFYYLERGDHIKIKWRGRSRYCCVQVTKSESCPVGTRGWIPYASLRRR